MFLKINWNCAETYNSIVPFVLQEKMKGNQKMTGSVRKRGKTWSYYFDMGKVDGKRKKKEKGGFRTKKEAETALAKAIAEYNNAGSVFEPSEITVADYLDEWFKLYCIPNLRYRSQETKSGIIRREIKPAIGAYKLKSLTPSALQSFANSLAEKGYSESYISSVICVLNNSLSYAVEPLQYISHNPMLYVRKPKSKKETEEKEIISATDWDALERGMRYTRYWMPLMIGYYTGMRVSEVLALTWDDVDLQNRKITVDKQIGERKDEDGKKALCFVEPKTKDSNRTIFFGETLFHAFIQNMDEQDGNRAQRREKYTEYKEVRQDGFRTIVKAEPQEKCEKIKFVCVSEKGNITVPSNIANCVVKAKRELGISFSFHALRHTHATLLVESGANIRDIQARLGHSSIQTTMGTYAHDTEQMARNTVALFEDAVKSSMDRTKNADF